MNLYVSLDEARTELHKRWQDEEFKKAIESELGEHFLPFFGKTPRAYLGRSLPTPDNGFVFFWLCAQYVKGLPLAPSYFEDKFVSINPDKKNLVTPFVVLRDGGKARAEIADIDSHEGKKIKQVKLRCGSKLIDFHQKLFELSQYKIELVDISTWFQKLGRPIHYYYYYLCHFLAHGVLFETFYQKQYEREIPFTTNIILPTINKIEQKFGLKPLIVRLYPEELNPNEEFYWCSYPPSLNDYIVDYAAQNKMRFRELSHLKQQNSAIDECTDYEALHSIN